MLTEEQRRALFALREALHLCQACRVQIQGEKIEFIDETGQQMDGGYAGPTLIADDVNDILRRNPES